MATAMDPIRMVATMETDVMPLNQGPLELTEMATEMDPIRMVETMETAASLLNHVLSS
jgi:hypothetical protein